MADDYHRILSIDYGAKRIGLALSDPLLIFAYPFDTIQNDKSLWINLEKILVEKNVSKIILGYPLKDDGGLSSNAPLILKFKKEIEKRFNKEVTLWDERYTSEMAKENILKSVSKKSKRREKGLIDRNSAAIILQEYLDDNK